MPRSRLGVDRPVDSRWAQVLRAFGRDAASSGRSSSPWAHRERKLRRLSCEAAPVELDPERAVSSTAFSSRFFDMKGSRKA